MEMTKDSRMVERTQRAVAFSVIMLITNIIKGLMSLLSPALLLPHLFNPECYHPHGALRSLKVPSFSDHLLLRGHCPSSIGNFSICPYYLP